MLGLYMAFDDFRIFNCRKTLILLQIEFYD
jgi:hypothetical protein